MSDTQQPTEKILYRVGKIAGELEELVVEDHIAIVASLNILLERRKVKMQREAHDAQNKLQQDMLERAETLQREKNFGVRQ